MTQPANGKLNELRRIVRMLDKTVEMAQDAELTGSLADRSTAAVRSYNGILTHLSSQGLLSTPLFAPLPDDANLTDVAMSSAQLAEYLRADLPDEEQEPRHGPAINRNLTIGNFNLGGGDKDELSQMIHDHLAEWFGGAKPQPASEPADEGVAGGEAASAPAASDGPGDRAANARRAALPSQARVEELRTEAPAAEARRP